MADQIGAILVYHGRWENRLHQNSSNFAMREGLRSALENRGFQVFPIFYQDENSVEELVNLCANRTIKFIYTVNFQLITDIKVANALSEMKGQGVRVVSLSDSWIGNFETLNSQSCADIIFHADGADIRAARHVSTATMHFLYRNHALPVDLETGEPFCLGDVKLHERDIDILFCGSFRSASLNDGLESLPKREARFVVDFVNTYACRQLTDSLQEVVYTEYEKRHPGLIVKYSYAHYYIALLINRILRDRRRAFVLDSLAPFNVVCISNGFSLGYVQNHPRWGCFGRQPRAVIQKLYRRAKIVVNVMPLYFYGMHERILTSMSAGAVAATDSNKLIDDTLTDFKDSILYGFDREAIQGKIADVLLNPNRLADMSYHGQEVALGKFTAGRFCDDLIGACNGTLTQTDIPY